MTDEASIIDPQPYSPFSYGDSPPPPGRAPSPALIALQREVEDFLAYEADLLDQWRYSEWLDITTDDIRYWAPLRRNVRYGEWERERTRELSELAWFDEDRTTLELRVHQLETGIHWIEEPRSRVTHIVTNVRIVSATPTAESATEVTVRSRFLVYRNHQDDQESTFIGKREDILRRVDGGLRLAARSVLLDQSTLLAPTLSVLL